ncbi:MAG TPA: hypothetical protein GX697_01125, partial [Firmicutes bacterium]|nr:hypothetical protein [Bacillota bacterium]
DSKEEARRWFNRLRQAFLDYNGAEWMSDEFKKIEEAIRNLLVEKTEIAQKEAV